ncbi:MAG: translation initiation factor IF-3 [Alphaproteobacteria bacterium]|nr:translation initiation factor IF-3 [Alphaproteobacteria bacterium]
MKSPPSRGGPRVNGAITSAKIRCIDENGEQLGIISVDEAIARAEDAGLDLIEVQPNVDPPVCKILDYGKFKYEAQKRANEARKKQKVVDVKEIKLRPNIDEHDYQVKMKNVRKFIDAGDKVKVTLRFRGREMAHQELGAQVLRRVREEMEELTRVEAMPKMEGRQMVMVLAPA